jgi:hypothetical protein
VGAAVAKLLNWRSFLMATVVATIFALIAASFVMGVERRMDRKIGFGPLNDVWHLSIAISDEVYGLKGYVGFYKVYQTLQYGLGIKDFYANDARQPDIVSISDGALINEAIAKASNLPQLRGLGPTFPRTLEAYRGGVGIEGTDLISPIGEDLGESKLYALSFRLFGLHIESAYYFFFLLLTISILAFLIEFRQKPAALAALLLNVFAFHAFFYLPFFSPFMPTVYINRFGSTLCIICAWHFLFMLIERRPWTLPSAIFAAVQMFILAFGIFIRSSGNWAFVAIFLLSLTLLFRDFLLTRGLSLVLRVRQAFKTVRLWSFLVVICGYILLNLYISIVPNPIFRSGGNQPHHMRWHSLWIGLSFHPDWPKYFPELPAGSDDTAQNMTMKLWVAAGNKPSDFNDPYTKAMNIGLHESLVRTQYLKFITEHPRYLLESVVYYKPMLLYNLLKQMYSGTDRFVIVPAAATVLPVAALTVLSGISALLVTLGLGGLVLLCSVAPILLAYPAEHVIGDQIWSTTVLLVGLIAVLFCGLIRIAAPVFRARNLAIGSNGDLAPPAGNAIAAASIFAWCMVGGLAFRVTLPTIYILNAHWGCQAGDPVIMNDFSNGAVNYLTLAKRTCEGHRSCFFNPVGPIFSETFTCKRQLLVSWQCGRAGPVTNSTAELNTDNNYYQLPLACR